jgi:hypothetical protein
LNNLPDNVRFYKYTVNSFYILFPDEKDPTIVDPSFVNSISIEKDFDQNFFPILKLAVSLKPSLYFKIIKNKLNIKFKFRLQMYASQDDTAFTFKYNIIDDVFCVYLDEDTPFIDEKLYNASKDVQNADTGVILTDLKNDYTFYLFKESDIQETKKILNTIITKANMTDTLTYLLVTNGFKNILMSPLDNISVYSEILIQPITLIGNILYLEQQFGLYNKGVLLFFDFDRLYILERGSKCTAWSLDEFKQTVFMIKDSLNASVNSPGSYIDKDAKVFYINVLKNNYQTINRSVVHDQTDGNNLIVINPMDGNTDQIDSKTIQRGSGTYKVVTNKYINKMQVKTEMTTRNENSSQISVNVYDFDITSLSPNKEFKFIFEDSKINTEYGGIYRMSKEMINFTKNGDHFHIMSSCQLKKQTV